VTPAPSTACRAFCDPLRSRYGGSSGPAQAPEEHRGMQPTDVHDAPSPDASPLSGAPGRPLPLHACACGDR
jgi:hypothetical protein